MLTGPEKRRHRRYQLTLELQVRPRKSSKGPIQTATRDISGGGILFELSGAVELGTELEFDLTLPPELYRGRRVQIHGRGRIVRVEPPDSQGRLSAAATIEEFQFL